MKQYTEFVNELQGYAEVYTKGLHDAKVGSFIRIGLQGNHNKWWGKIEKIDKNGRFVTTDDDIFDKNGQLYRAKTPPFQQHLKRKLKVSAIIITKEDKKADVMETVKKQIYENLILPCKDPQQLLEVTKIFKTWRFPNLEEIINDK